VTTALSCREIADKLERQFPGSIAQSSEDSLVVKNEHLLGTATFLKTSPGLDFNYLASVTAVDYRDYFELVYHLTSIEHNHSLILKTRCSDRKNPAVSSVVSLWQGADYQEREIYDLMGINFEGHPNLKRIVLWEGFKGYPLRKDYVNNAN
jgi:NADH-quinone oxidoreductase subunit C